MPRTFAANLPGRSAGFRRLATSLAGALLVCLSGCGHGQKQGGGASSGGPPQDLVLLTLDTFRVDRAGCCGNPEGLTPSIDRVARSGLLARTAFTPAPLTAVSHATILTGLQPYHHGVRDNGLFPLSGSIPTLASQLASQGFKTAGFIAAFPLKGRFGFNHGFSTFDDQLAPDPAQETYYAERPAREVVDSALKWAATLAPTDRAFLWAHFYDAHAPHTPRAPLRRLPVAGDYEREIRGMDSEIGRLLRTLEDAGRRPLLVVVSDHGEGLRDHGEWQHGILLHHETMCGLLTLAAPAGSAISKQLHGVHEGVTRYADIAPTVLAALGAVPLENVDGASLLSSPPPDGSYGESYFSMLHYRWSPLLSWRDAKWAYVEGPKPALYDVVADPQEKQNVIAAHADVASAMSQKIEQVEQAPQTSSVQGLDQEAREKLTALGYVADGVGAFDPKKDPADYLEAVNALDEGASLLLQNQPQAALGPLQTAYRADPENPTIVFQLANCWRLLNDVDHAIAFYEKSVKIDARNPVAWANLALLEFGRGKTAEALQIAADGVKSNPDAFVVLLTAGELSRSVGRTVAARDYLARATKAEPNRPEAWEARAKLEEQAGNAADAKTYRERAQAVKPPGRG